MIARFGLALAVAGASLLAAPPGQPRPVDAAGAIFDAFRTHAVVGLSDGETHGDERGWAFVISLIRDARFADTTIDLVTENANARYQDVMDRYVHGDEVPYSALRRVWDDTTQPQAMMNPIGEIPLIYRALREVNASLPRARHHRALLGDPPIEWENVHTNADYQRWLALRDSHAAAVIEREVIARKRWALIFYGRMHLQRKQQIANYQMDDPLAQTVISLLERTGVRPFVVVAMSEQDGVTSWPVPSIARLRGTTLGAQPMPEQTQTRVSVRGGKLVPIPRQQWITMRMEDQFDAVLYLGPASTLRVTPLSPTICADAAYVETHLQRMAIAGLPPKEANRLRQLCGR
jgi:hypothetical protein